MDREIMQRSVTNETDPKLCAFVEFSDVIGVIRTRLK